MIHDVISLLTKAKVGTLDTERYVLRTTDRRLRALWDEMKKHGVSVDTPARGSLRVAKVTVVPLVGYLAWAMLRLRKEGFTFQLPSNQASRQSADESKACSSRPSRDLRFRDTATRSS